MTTYVVPERYAWAAAHGYHRLQRGVKIGTCFHGIRFGDEDEVVIIGRLGDDTYDQLQIARASSAGIPRITYIPGERIERPAVRREEKKQIAAFLLRDSARL